jgi:biopolymer transport protein ExbD
MKKITLLFLCLILLLAISCTNPMKDFKESNIKASYRFTDNPGGMKNAKPDAHAAEETAIHVAADDSNLIFVGKEQYARDVFGDKVKSLLAKTPGEKSLIYVNASQNMKYSDLLSILDALRKQEIDNIGLVVTPATKNDTYFNILKIKMTPEPRMDDPVDSPFSGRDQLFVNLAKDKINFGGYDKNYSFKLEKEELNVEGLQAKIAQRLKEREEKKVLVLGTSEVDKRVFIRATKSSDYRRVAQMVDAATGAGASVVYLQIDDMAD